MEFKASKRDPPLGSVIAAAVAKAAVKVTWGNETSLAVDPKQGIILSTEPSIIRYAYLKIVYKASINPPLPQVLCPFLPSLVRVQRLQPH